MTTEGDVDYPGDNSLLALHITNHKARTAHNHKARTAHNRKARTVQTGRLLPASATQKKGGSPALAHD